jgi:hypothetical protein
MIIPASSKDAGKLSTVPCSTNRIATTWPIKNNPSQFEDLTSKLQTLKLNNIICLHNPYNQNSQ